MAKRGCGALERIEASFSIAFGKPRRRPAATIGAGTPMRCAPTRLSSGSRMIPSSSAWSVIPETMPLRAILYMLVNAIWMTLLVPVALALMLLSWNSAVGNWMARKLWAPFLLRITGSHINIQGSENVDRRLPTVYVSNHQSTIDIPILFIALPVNFRFVAKSQLRWVPVLGWYMWAAGHIFIDRSHRRRALE